MSRLQWVTNNILHCKDKMPKICNKYSQKRNIGVSVQITTFMCLWANYIFPRWVCLFCWRKYVDRSWEYKNRLQTHECWNWGWGRAIPRKGIYKRNCRCSVVWFIQQTICLMWLVIYKMQFMWVVTTWCSCCLVWLGGDVAVVLSK